jgi:RNA recognition motif-containing protein
MQETLNEMVSKVRRGMVSPEDASRTIHGSAAMLGLQLAETLPENTLIVTGMRKQVTKDHIAKAFKEFGEIESAAVSSKQRGFGVVRYRSPKSVQNAMNRFRYGEIVVQDGGVMIRVLKVDSGEVDFTRQYSNERGRVR